MNTEKSNKILISLLVFLIVIVSVQGLFIFRLYQKSHQPLASGSEELSTIVPVDVAPKASVPNNDQQNESNKAVPNNNYSSFGFDSFWDDFDQESWNPFDEMQRMREKMDHMFQNSLGRFRLSPSFKGLLQDDFFSPSMDLKEEKDKYIIRLDIPGMEKSNIDVHLNDRVLTITGNRNVEHKKNQSDQMFHQERFRGQFKRSFTLPGPVDDTKMKAEYKDGVLIITVPKASKAKVKKQLKVI